MDCEIVIKYVQLCYCFIYWCSHWLDASLNVLSQLSQAHRQFLHAKKEPDQKGNMWVNCVLNGGD